MHTVYPIFKVHSSDFFSNIFFSMFACFARVGKKFLSSLRVFLACFDYPNISASFVRNICLADAFLCLLLPNDIRVLFPKKALFLRLAFSLFSLYLPLFYRPTSGRRPREQRHNSPPTKVLFVNICHRQWLSSARGFPREFPSGLLPLSVMLSRFRPRDFLAFKP